MTVPQILARSFAGSLRMIKLFTEDFTAADWLHRTSPEANCAAWTVGHLILSERSLHKRLGVTSPSIPEVFEARFARDATAPKSAEFGDTSILLQLFEQHRQSTIEAVAWVDVATLATPVEKPHPMFTNVGELLTFMSLHTAMHAGQITQIRRALGRPPLI